MGPVGPGLLADRCLPGGSGRDRRWRHLLRQPAHGAGRALQAERRTEPGGGPAGRTASSWRTCTRARRPLVGQRPLGCRRAGLAHRPIDPRRPPRGGPRHARPLRGHSQTRLAPTARRTHSPPVGRTGSASSSSSLSWCIRCSSAVATAARSRPWPGGTPDGGTTRAVVRRPRSTHSRPPVLLLGDAAASRSRASHCRPHIGDGESGHEVVRGGARPRLERDQDAEPAPNDRRSRLRGPLRPARESLPQ